MELGRRPREAEERLVKELHKRKRMEQVSSVIATHTSRFGTFELHHYPRTENSLPVLKYKDVDSGKEGFLDRNGPEFDVILGLLKNIKSTRVRQNAVFLALVSTLNDTYFLEYNLSLEKFITIATPVYEGDYWDANVIDLLTSLYDMGSIRIDHDDQPPTRLLLSDKEISVILSIVRDVADTTRYTKEDVHNLFTEILDQQKTADRYYLKVFGAKEFEEILFNGHDNQYYVNKLMNTSFGETLSNRLL